MFFSIFAKMIPNPVFNLKTSFYQKKTVFQTQVYLIWKFWKEEKVATIYI